MIELINFLSVFFSVFFSFNDRVTIGSWERVYELQAGPRRTYSRGGCVQPWNRWK